MQSILAHTSRNVFFKSTLLCTSRALSVTSSRDAKSENLTLPDSDLPPAKLEELKASLETNSLSSPAIKHADYLTPIPKTALQCTNIDELRVFLKSNLLSRPPVEHGDYLTPTSSTLLDKTISSFIPHASSSSHRQVLPEGHHLVYFPSAIPINDLLPDGTDSLHSPGLPFVRRLWAGGSLSISQEARSHLAFTGERAFCRESIVDVDVKGTEGDEKVIVEIERKYGLWKYRSHYSQHKWEWMADKDKCKWWPVVERRKLVFLREESNKHEYPEQNIPEISLDGGHVSSEGIYSFFRNRVNGKLTYNSQRWCRLECHHHTYTIPLVSVLSPYIQRSSYTP